MLIIVIILSIIEGLTEFFPVSSTGHLVVASSFLGFEAPWREPFLIVIQFGAILAVVVDRREHLWAIIKGGGLVPFAILLFLGFLPAAVVGLALRSVISGLLRNPVGVSIAWIAGGIAILIFDRPQPRPTSPGREVRLENDRSTLPNVSPKQAFLIGLAQVLSLWPGVSRSAATIVGGLLVGLDRPTATLFSFYLAIPTMFAASSYEMFKHRHDLEGSGVPIALGMGISFVVAWATVRWLLRYVQTHTFRPFAIYRIIAGLLLLFLDIPWAK